MPYANPEKRIEASRKWRKKKIAAGYGKALYARRAARYRNEEILRQAAENALAILGSGNHTQDRKISEVKLQLERALEDAPLVGSPINYMPKESHEQEAPEDP